jgi:hypothetical protein
MQKREEIKDQLANGTYKTLGRVIANWAAWVIQMPLRRSEPLPFWYSMTVTILVISLIAYLLDILFNAPYTLLLGAMACFAATTEDL